MVRKNQHIPKAGKCDLIEGILIGGQETNNLNKRNQDAFKPAVMSRKFVVVARECNSPGEKKKSEFIIEALKPFNPDIPLPEAERKKILSEANAIKIKEVV